MRRGFRPRLRFTWTPLCTHSDSGLNGVCWICATFSQFQVGLRGGCTFLWTRMRHSRRSPGFPTCKVSRRPFRVSARHQSLTFKTDKVIKRNNKIHMKHGYLQSWATPSNESGQRSGGPVRLRVRVLQFRSAPQPTARPRYSRGRISRNSQPARTCLLAPLHGVARAL